MIPKRTLTPKQATLIDVEPDWRKDWVGMPEFDQKNLKPWQTIKVHFQTLSDRYSFANVIDQKITDETKYIWHPKKTFKVGHVYKTDENVLPRYPIYIISKGRWESRLTSKSLDKIGIHYHICVEPQEYDNYAAVIDPSKIYALPFENLGLGSIPARNWVWEHALGSGAARHWILDDNISGFCRLNQNIKAPVETGAMFRAAEDFTDRYTNVALSGFNYRFFAVASSDRIKPFTLNTRIYSCILIANNIPYRWRGRYNEDTDLSLRALKDGYCTILFNTFLANKTGTMKMKGGNTDELYAGDGRLKMAQSLMDQHPDCVTITKKWNRDQHQVNYSRFTQELALDPETIVNDEVDNFGMKMLDRI